MGCGGKVFAGIMFLKPFFQIRGTSFVYPFGVFVGLNEIDIIHNSLYLLGLLSSLCSLQPHEGGAKRAQKSPDEIGTLFLLNTLSCGAGS